MGIAETFKRECRPMASHLMSGPTNISLLGCATRWTSQAGTTRPSRPCTEMKRRGLKLY